jgi:hypothetical protein
MRFSQQDYIAIVAALPDGRLPIVRQYRPALESFTWELPAGLVESGEDAAACCRRELMEENPWFLRNEPNVANPNCSSRSHSVTAGVEFIDENAYESDHDAPTPTIAWHHREDTEWPAGKLVLARSFAYGFRADRVLKGLKTGTPVGSKSETFRVATVRPCSSAVAEMARSIPPFPIR